MAPLCGLPIRITGSRFIRSIDILPTAFAGGVLESPRGFPASRSLARVGFHRTGSYGLSTGIEDREPHGPYILFRAFFLLCVSALRFRQFLLILMKKLGVANDLTIGENHKGFQAQVGTKVSTRPRPHTRNGPDIPMPSGRGFTGRSDKYNCTCSEVLYV